MSWLIILGVDCARTPFVHILLFGNMFNDVQWCSMMFNDVQWCSLFLKLYIYILIQLANVRLVEIKCGPTIQRKHLHLLWVAGRHSPVAAVSLSITNPIFYGSVQQQQQQQQQHTERIFFSLYHQYWSPFCAWPGCKMKGTLWRPCWQYLHPAACCRQDCDQFCSQICRCSVAPS